MKSSLCCRSHLPRLLFPSLALLLSTAMVHGMAPVAEGQTRQLSSIESVHSPQGETLPKYTTVSLNDSRSALLNKTISVKVKNVSIAQALRAISADIDDRIMFDERIANDRRKVTLNDSRITVGQALQKILGDLPAEVLLSNTGQSLLIRHSGKAQQTGIVQGQVRDAGSKRPIEAATVSIVGTRIAQTTDSAGRYRLSGIPPGTYRIRITRIGFSPHEESVTISGETPLTVDASLKGMIAQLSEVVTTASGSRTKLELGNYITTINADSLMQTTAIRNMTDLLAARAPGLQVMYSSGLTGVGSRIRIRGITSPTLSNDPIVIVDGVRMDATPFRTNSVASASRQATAPTPSRLDDLDPESIESIEVLRGPSASTLYGTDASNGVIVIVTKKGRVGTPQFSLSGQFGLQEMPTKFQETWQAWGTNPSNPRDLRCRLLDQAEGRCTFDSLTHFSPLNDPDLSPFRNGRQSKLTGRVDGGYSALRYSMTGTWYDEQGTIKMPKSEIRRLTTLRNGDKIPDWQLNPNVENRKSIDANVSADLSDYGNITVSTGYTSRYFRVPLNGSAFGSGGGLMWSAQLGPGYRDYKDGWGPSIQGERPGYSLSYRTTQESGRFYGAINSVLNPLPTFAVRTSLGIDVGDQEDGVLSRPGEGLGFTPVNGEIGRSAHRSRVYTVRIGTDVERPIGNGWKARSAAGVDYTRSNRAYMLQYGKGLTLGSETIIGAQEVDYREDTDQSATAGWFLEQTMSYDDRIFLTGAFRNDLGSAFGDAAKSARYPKLSVSWITSQEPWFPVSKAIGSMRIRAAFGQSGKQPGAKDALALFANEQGVINGALVGIAKLRSFGNPLLRAERGAELEGGADMSFWDDRAILAFTMYRKVTQDAMFPIRLPASLGYGAAGTVGSRNENIGTVVNAGFEGSLNTQLIRGRMFSLDIGLSGSIHKNTLTQMNADVVLPLDQSNRFVKGYPIFGVWDRPILGYTDVNNDGIIVPDEVLLGDSAVFYGSSTPTRQLIMNYGVGTFNNRLRLNTTFEYRGGNVLRNLTNTYICSGLSSGVMCRAANDPSTPLAQQAASVIANGPLARKSMAGTFEPGNYLKLREMSISYNVSSELSRRLVRARSLNVALMARNLGVWSRYRGDDPESNANSRDNGAETGFDRGSVPQQRIWTLRFNLGFY